MSDKSESFDDDVNENIKEFFGTLDNGMASIHDAFVFMQKKLQAVEEENKSLREAVEFCLTLNSRELILHKLKITLEKVGGGNE